MLAQTTCILFFETSFDHSKMFSLNQMVPLPLTRILTRSLSLHLSRSCPFSTTTLCPDLIFLLHRDLAWLPVFTSLSPKLATYSTVIGGQNTPTININIHVVRRTNKASIAKILGKIYSQNTRLHNLFLVTDFLVIKLHM